MKVVVTAFLGLLASAGVAVADMSAQLGTGWDGGAVTDLPAVQNAWQQIRAWPTPCG